MPVANKELIRAINRFNILNTIRVAGAVSRVEIAEITGQSRASVSNITAHLIQEKLIYEKQTKDSRERGRKRILLALNPQAAHVVGIKLASFRVGIAVTDMQADVKTSLVMPVRISERPVAYVADLIQDGVRHCVREAGLRLGEISGIGIGMPGFINSRTGLCSWTPLDPTWQRPLQDLVQERFAEMPTYIENDTNTVTLAHQWFGEGRGIDNFLTVTIEDGLGMGIVVNGQLYRGAHGYAAEFGHMVVAPGGRFCRCGKRGCLEAYVSNFAVTGAARQAAREGRWKDAPESELTFDAVIKAAQTGQPALGEIFQTAGQRLGEGLAVLVQIFNPSKIIISGDGVKAGNLMFDPMQDTLARMANSQILASTRVVIQKWHDVEWARGAASLVLQELYKSPLNRVRPVI